MSIVQSFAHHLHPLEISWLRWPTARNSPWGSETSSLPLIAPPTMSEFMLLTLLTSGREWMERTQYLFGNIVTSGRKRWAEVSMPPPPLKSCQLLLLSRNTYKWRVVNYTRQLVINSVATCSKAHFLDKFTGYMVQREVKTRGELV